jgi:hypothetical protein
MADGTADDTGTDGTPRGGPSLEMPSFTRRRRKGEGAEPASEAVVDTTVPEPDASPGPWPAARVRRPLPRPSLAGLPAAAVTGVVVGALGVLLVWLAGVGCEAVRGTSSCGGGPGLLVLVVVLGVLAWTGSLVMVFLLGSLEQWWTAVAVPVAAVAAYCSAWWVTTAVVGED